MGTVVKTERNQRIVALKKEKKTMGDIAALMDMSRNAVAGVLNRARRDGLLDPVPRVKPAVPAFEVPETVVPIKKPIPKPMPIVEPVHPIPPVKNYFDDIQFDENRKIVVPENENTGKLDDTGLNLPHRGGCKYDVTIRPTERGGGIIVKDTPRFCNAPAMPEKSWCAGHFLMSIAPDARKKYLKK